MLTKEASPQYYSTKYFNLDYGVTWGISSSAAMTILEVEFAYYLNPNEILNVIYWTIYSIVIDFNFVL